MSDSLLRDAALAEDLASEIRHLFSVGGTNWGVLSLALASALATGAQDAFPENRASGRRLINETHAVARALLNDMHNAGHSDATGKAMEAVLDTAQASKVWAGDKTLQEDLTRKLLELIDGQQMISIAGAFGTIIANIICDRATSLPDAITGIKAFLGDCRRTARERFTTGRHAAADAQGTA